ncbi:MAG: DUF3576 domain-containing protein [Gammaproteobacteria bacterium]
MKKYISLSLVAMLSACSVSKEDVSTNYPKSREEQEEERLGKLTGEDGLVLFGGSKKSAGTEGINVNGYLWRAALDMVYFMPLISADPFGGTILTDWYKLKDSARERYKLNVFIIGPELRSDAVRVAAFKQKLSGSNWVDVDGGQEIAKEIENKILLRARELKYNSGN